MVGARSKSAIGSIAHFYGDKVQLAAAVYESIADLLVTSCMTALNGEGSAVPKAVRALQSALVRWEQTHPGYLRLINLLEVSLVNRPEIMPRPLRDRLAALLAGWAERFVNQGRVIALAPSQLLAVVLGPVMMILSDPAFSSSENSSDWWSFLAETAISAVQVGERPHKTPFTRGGSKKPAKAEPFPVGGQGGLF
jgi:AcrR family transcriptional regulator